MKKIFIIMEEVIAYGMAISLILIMLISSIQYHCFDKSLYHNEYKRLHTSQTLGMTETDLFLATDTLLDYLEKDIDTIDVDVTIKGVTTKAFNSKESAHMKDVQNLYQFALMLRRIAVVFLMLGFVYLFIYNRKDLWTIFSIHFMKTAVIFAVVVFILAGWAYIDFDAFWTVFHRLSFRNDLWLLDPNTDLMINLFPASFFSHLVFKIIQTFFLCFFVVFALCYYYLHRKLKIYHKEQSNE